MGRLKTCIGAGVAAILAGGALAAAAAADQSVDWMKGFDAPGTPKKYDKVGVIKIGPKSAKNVLVLNPGTSAGSAYFVPLAKSLVGELKGWQVWSVERRENLLEDQSESDKYKAGKVTSKQFFDYYLGYLTDNSVTKHVQPVPDSAVPFARDWGMNVELHDLRNVVKAAQKLGGKVVVGGHSLGGSMTTAYATWDFNGKAGAKGLSGLVFIDGASSPDPVTKHDAKAELADLQTSTPWLAFGGIGAPYAGLFANVGSGLAREDPNTKSQLDGFLLLPPDLQPPVTTTNEAGFGYASDVDTSPGNLAAFQVHDGQLAASGDPRPWDQAGDITPVLRYADMLFGTDVKGTDGSAWYHPMRLSIDSGAVGDGNKNPAQKVLDVKATHGDDVHLPMYAFGAALGNTRVLDAVKTLAKQSGVPKKDVTLIDRSSTYAHNDPNAAAPKRNAFLKHLVPFLRGIAH